MVRFNTEGSILSQGFGPYTFEEVMNLGNLSTGNYLLQAIGLDGKVGAKLLQIRN